MKVLVLRAAHDANRTAARLAALGHEAIVSSVIEILPVDHEIPDAMFDAVIATSAHAFRKPATGALASLPLFVVGNETAEAALRAGFMSSSFTAARASDLAARLNEYLPMSTRLLYFAGRQRKSDLERALRADIDLQIVETYSADSAIELSEEACAALNARVVGAALHYSRRSAAIFCSIVAAHSLRDASAGIRHIAISADAAVPLAAMGWRIEIAASPDETAMFRTLETR